MIGIFSIAIAAGCASALMFASIISGALISLLLFNLAPLPLMVAAIGWGPLTATFGGIAAAIGLGAMYGLPYCVAFAVTVALPAWWLGHLVMLGRPVAGALSDDNGTPVAPDLEWYPIGRILLWIAGFAALTTMAALLTLGTDATTITETLRQGLMRIMGLRNAELAETEQWINTLIAVAPAAAGLVSMMTLTLNLWLAAKTTATSGTLRRPWPDLKSVALPPMTLAILCAAIAFCFVGGLVAILAQITTAALLMAYAITGFAVLHTLTMTLKSRAFWLGSTYAIVMIFTWPLLVMAVLGLADAVFGFRQRYLRGRPPPIPAS